MKVLEPEVKSLKPVLKFCEYQVLTAAQTPRDSSNSILQTGSSVQIKTKTGKQIQIDCADPTFAKRLALTLSGLTVDYSNTRMLRFLKKSSHPWYGSLILGDEDGSLSNSDRKWIVLFLDETKLISENEFNKKVAHLFVDNPDRPDRHALIQEIVSLGRMK